MHRVSIEIWMEEIRGEEVYFRHSSWMTEEQVFFEQAIPYPVGTKMYLRFLLPQDTNEITVAAHVLGSTSDKKKLGMTVAFDNFMGDGKERLLRVLQSAR